MLFSNPFNNIDDLRVVELIEPLIVYLAVILAVGRLVTELIDPLIKI